MSKPATVLLVDLNNFARYPTLSIGYLAAILRKANYRVDVFSPLMVGVKGTVRESKPKAFSLSKARLNHQFATSNSRLLRQLRNTIARKNHSEILSHQAQVIAAFNASLEQSKPQVVLVSSYLMYRDVCVEICRICRQRQIAVVIGGPYFVQPEVYSEWVKIDGLNGLIAGELELEAPALIESLLHQRELTLHQGVLRFDGNGDVRGQIARPLKTLDDIPFPDFSDFPWQQYPNRIVPVITGRGCGWGACSFCSDVTSSTGRTYRSRSADNVLAEIRHQYDHYNVTNFVFVDLKLNSNLEVWRAIIRNIQSVAPGAKWIASVHVGQEEDNGLSADDLKAAADSGCVRLTTGLESGSQRIADRMKKGVQLDQVSEFIKRAKTAGISIRCTMIIGYPDETHVDIDASSAFLANHTADIERIHLNRLAMISGTPLVRQIKRDPNRYKGFRIVAEDGAMANVEHFYDAVGQRPHRSAVRKLLGEVFKINAQEMSLGAQDFEGVM